jgi:hypothetical protein
LKRVLIRKASFLRMPRLRSIDPGSKRVAALPNRRMMLGIMKQIGEGESRSRPVTRFREGISGIDSVNENRRHVTAWQRHQPLRHTNRVVGRLTRVLGVQSRCRP